VDIAVPTSGQLDKYDKAFAALMMPFAFADLAHARRAMDGPMLEWLSPKAEEAGLEIIGVWEYGFRNLTNSRRPINRPEDVAGLKIRTPPEIQLSAAMAALGANVQKIASPSSTSPCRRAWSTARRTRSPRSGVLSSTRCRTTSRSRGTCTRRSTRS
jgi:TRAP-type transport system periplasmic protein